MHIASGANAEVCGQYAWATCTDVIYGPQPYQLLDVHHPAAGGHFPTIIYVHGGDWYQGDKHFNLYPDVTNVLREIFNGYAVVSVNYRLATSVNDPSTIAPGALLDVKQAIGWVKAHGADYGLDSSRIVLWGHSAGGHLATLAAAYPPADSSIKGVFSFAGVYDFTLSLPVDTALGASLYLRCLSPGAQQLWLNTCSSAQLTKWSPINYVSSDDPPVMILHNQDDPIVPFNQAQVYANKLGLYGKGSACTSASGGHAAFGACNSPVDTKLRSWIAPGPR